MQFLAIIQNLARLLFYLSVMDETIFTLLKPYTNKSAEM